MNFWASKIMMIFGLVYILSHHHMYKHFSAKYEKLVASENNLVALATPTVTLL